MPHRKDRTLNTRLATAIVFVGLAFAGHLTNAQAGPQTTVKMSQASLVECANSGVAECQFQLGELVENGKGVMKDLDSAKALYTLAYRNGYDPAGTALLRLTKASVSAVTPAAPVAVDHTNADKSVTVLGSATIDIVKPAPPRTPVFTSSPASWGISGNEKQALTVAGLFLGESEQDFSTKVEKPDCENHVSLPPSRRCNATIANGKVDIEADFLGDELVSVMFGAKVAPIECDYEIGQITTAIGRTNHGFASHFLSMLIPGGAGKFWTRANWMVASGCEMHKDSPADLLLIVMRNDAQKIQD